MAQTKRISRILIADENPFFRSGLRALFSADASLTVVGEASDASAVIMQIRDLRPNALVISADLLRHYEASGIGQSIRKVMPELLTLVLAQDDSAENLSAAVTCGAKGLVLKSTKPADLTMALRNVAFQEGGMNWSGLLPDFDALAKHTPATVSNSVLTAREQEVVRLLAEGKTVRMVAQDLRLSMKTIEAHKLNLMRKLDIHDRASLVAYANRQGLVAAEV